MTDSFWGATVCKDVDVKTEYVPLNPKITNAGNPCSRWRTDNADHSKYYVTVNGDVPVNRGKGQMTIYNTADNSFYDRPNLAAYEGEEFRWDGTNPRLMYYRQDCQFYSYEIVTKRSTLLHDFTKQYPTCSRAINDVEGDASPDSRYWAFMLLGPYALRQYQLLAIVTYDKQNDAIVGTLDEAKYVAQGGNASLWNTYGYRPNAVDIAPDGAHVLATWPMVRYPVTYQIGVAPDARHGVSLVSGTLTLPAQSELTSVFSVGDTVGVACSGKLAGLSASNWKVTAVSPQSLSLDVSAAGLSNGNWTSSSTSCIHINASTVVSVTASGTTATMVTGIRHNLRVGDQAVLRGVPGPGTALNATVKVVSVIDQRTVTFKTTATAGIYTASGMTWEDSKWGAGIDDDDFTFPAYKASNFVANDGPHVYALDFSTPVKVCNGDTHAGWAWDLNGDLVYICQINHANWKRAEVDTIGFTNIRTGVYTPVLSLADVNFDPGSTHHQRFYDPSIRGWGTMSVSSKAGSQNPLRNQFVAFELKHYNQHPEIWRIGSLHNVYLNYYTEAQAALSGDGLKLRWDGNWGIPGNYVNAYSMDIPLRIKTRGSVKVLPSSTGATITYIASTTAPCSVTVSPHADYSKSLQLPSNDGGGDQHRTFLVGARTPLTTLTTYYYKVDCTWDVMSGSFTTTAAHGLNDAQPSSPVPSRPPKVVSGIPPKGREGTGF